ncbi:MAG: hypothetical protein HYS04_20715 [Acidobacteria bacterium]|nr:hypothetical protein [Acidobacteriota bacterium]
MYPVSEYSALRAGILRARVRGINEALRESPADWISPHRDAEQPFDYWNNLPPGRWLQR